MAARRNKNQARRTGGGNGTPGWVWLVVGVVLGAALLFTVPGLLKKDGDGFFRPKPNPDAQPAPVAETDSGDVIEDSAPAKPATAQPATPAKQTDFEFYTLLPGKEVQMSDAELAASARAERERADQERQRAAAQQTRETQTAAAPTSVSPATAVTSPAPRPIDETPTPTPAKPAEPRPVATAPDRTETKIGTPAAADARYILQAGAFGASGDAEATKAKIALLGLSARVESAQINGKTVYRVRMGPYGTASELAEAKQKLSGSGLSAMAIRAQ
jgi:cell division protein FtsN